MKVPSQQGRIWLPIVIFIVAIVSASSRVVGAQKDVGDTSRIGGQSDILRVNSLNESDEAFIKAAIVKFGDRRAASRALALQGWSSIREGNVDFALQRFDEARLLNAKNYQAYWGYGAVLSAQGKLPEAIENLEIARELIDDPNERVSLLSDMGSVYSEYAARLSSDSELDGARAFVNANQRFAESLEIDRDYARSWREWAISLHQQERFSEAWIKAQRAIELKAEPFPAEFLNSLRGKMSNSR